MATRGKKYTLSKFYNAAKKIFRSENTPRIEQMHCAVELWESHLSDEVEIRFEVTLFYTPIQSPDHGNFTGKGRTPDAAIEEAKRQYNEHIEPFFSLVEDRTEI